MGWRLTYAVVAGVLLLMGSTPALVPPAAAQVVVGPDTLRLALPEGQTAAVALEVTNTGGGLLRLFAVPLPAEGVPEDVGELLFHTAPATVDDARGLAMTPGGRLFAATYGGSGGTREYTAALGLVRSFGSPRTGDFTTGLAWMPPKHAPPGHPEGTLWNLDVAVTARGSSITIDHTRLVEGDLNGSPTGRTVELITGPGGVWHDRGVPAGLGYDDEGGLFYYTDIVNEDIYAISVDGEVAAGYPVPLTDYDTGEPERLSLHSFGSSRAADGAFYLEAGFVLPEDVRYERVVVADRWGRNTGVETPLGGLTAPDGEGPLIQVNGVLRSRIDPSVLYLAVRAENDVGYPAAWLYAIRAHPLPPRWLRVSPVAPLSLTLAPGAADTLTVRLDTEGLAVGIYEGQVALRRDGPNGEEVTAVPVLLTVTEGTATEAGPQSEAFRLGVPYPNPARGPVTVPLTLRLPERARADVAVYDVLGRRIASLADGRFEAGAHRLAFDGVGLPPGVYVIRATVEAGDGGTQVYTQRLTLMK